MNKIHSIRFSQSSLQDYTDCPRRFQLRYIEHLTWPAPQAQPILEHERRLDLGRDFHRLVQQHLLGIPKEKLMPTDADLQRWWQAYLATRPTEIEGRRYIEATLTTAVAGQPLSAQLDLIVIGTDHALIIDWKTSARPEKPDAAQRLFERLQTRVYRYLLVSAGAALNDGQPINPKQVSMMYWFAESPDAPVHYPYDAVQFQADERLLTALIFEIRTRNPDEVWDLTTQKRHCAFCPYRSLCERGTEAGELTAEVDIEAFEPQTFDLDFDQIAEIPF